MHPRTLAFNLWNRRLHRGAVTVAAALMMWLSGCPPMDGVDTGTGGGDAGGDGGATNGTPGVVTGVVNTFITDAVLRSCDPAVSVSYTLTGMPDTVSGIVVPIDAFGQTGDRQVIATDLPIAGDDTRFNLDPAQVGPGTFFVGILVTTGNTDQEILASGRVSVEEPAPAFVLPLNPITEVAAGDVVAVSFDAGAPVAERVDWRLFFFSPVTVPPAEPVSPDQLGTEIAIGNGAIGSAQFSTAGLEPGDYQLGLSVTTVGSTVEQAVAAGRGSCVATIPDPLSAESPVVRVVAP